MNSSLASIPIALLVALAAFVGCTNERDAAGNPAALAIENVIQDMAEAVAEQEPHAILAHVAYDFEADDGLDFGGVQALVFQFLARERIYTAEVEELAVDPETSEDERSVHALVRFMPADAPEPWTRYRIDARFTRMGSKWAARSGSYARVDRSGP